MTYEWVKLNIWPNEFYCDTSKSQHIFFCKISNINKLNNNNSLTLQRQQNKLLPFLNTGCRLFAAPTKVSKRVERNKWLFKTDPLWSTLNATLNNAFLWKFSFEHSQLSLYLFPTTIKIYCANTFNLQCGFNLIFLCIVHLSKDFDEPLNVWSPPIVQLECRGFFAFVFKSQQHTTLENLAISSLVLNIGDAH